MKLYNFGAGPAILPPEVVAATADAVKNFNGMGLSLMEIGHRTPEFKAVIAEAQSLMRELLHIPDHFAVLFLGGGARLQFDMIPMNFLKTKACYVDSGHWAHQAMQSAQMWGNAEAANTVPEGKYDHWPAAINIDANADYLHITTNNTIYGTELRKDLDSPIPVVADMSSDILTRPIDFSNYGLIYGGAQKNLSMAGVTFVIINTLKMGHPVRQVPPMLDYSVHIAHDSMYNTPPMLPIYTALQTLRWVKSQGGVKEMEHRAHERANLLYAEIDRNPLFRCTAVSDRSLMNCCFVLNEPYRHLEDSFVQFALQHGIYGIKGHRLVGGFRASLYNAMPLEGVQALVNCLQAFEKEVFKG